METEKTKEELIKDKIESFQDFPKKGIIFRDIFSVLRDPKATKLLIECCEERIRHHASDFDVIVGLESRGFLFGAVLAQVFAKPFVAIRKKGKLPGDVAQISYQLEYGEDCFEMQKASIKAGNKAIIVDDLLATGGTMKAAEELVSSVGAEVSLCLICIELLDLHGRAKIKSKVETIISF